MAAKVTLIEETNPIIEVKRYKTEDGRIFETEEEAKKHLTRLELAEKIENDIYCRDTSGEDIADWIIENLKFSFK